MLTRFLILRIVLGLMCVAFAYLLGRALARRGHVARRGLGPASWAVRTLLAGGAITWRAGIDALAAGVYALAAVAAGTGFYLARRPRKPPEDLTKQMFPEGG